MRLLRIVDTIQTQPASAETSDGGLLNDESYPEMESGNNLWIPLQRLM